jgi:hypothetical protein
MGRLTYVCATCSEHFTRRYSATRHNLTIHNGRGEIVPLLEYLVGRKIGRYQASHPSWYRRRSKEKHIHNFGHANVAVVADSMGDNFRHRGLQQQTPFQSTPRALSLPSTSQPQPQGVLSYPTDRISQPIHKTNDQGPLSQETPIKIQELTRLMYKYHSNPDAFVRCATFYSSNGDTSLLDEWLERFRNIDANSK